MIWEYHYFWKHPCTAAKFPFHWLSSGPLTQNYSQFWYLFAVACLEHLWSPFLGWLFPWIVVAKLWVSFPTHWIVWGALRQKSMVHDCSCYNPLVHMLIGEMNRQVLKSITRFTNRSMNFSMFLLWSKRSCIHISGTLIVFSPTKNHSSPRGCSMFITIQLTEQRDPWWLCPVDIPRHQKMRPPQ